MRDPRVFWLVLTNLVLGLVVVLLLFGVVAGMVCDWVAKFRKGRATSHELDEDMRRMFHGGGPR